MSHIYCCSLSQPLFDYVIALSLHLPRPSLGSVFCCHLPKHISLLQSLSGRSSYEGFDIKVPEPVSFYFPTPAFLSDNMCTGKCSRFVAVALYPLVLISIICNILLFFPGWDVKYVQDGNITEEVKYMGGLVGGGLMVSSSSYSSLLSVIDGFDSGVIWTAVNSFVKCSVQPRRNVILMFKPKTDTCWLHMVFRSQSFLLQDLFLCCIILTGDSSKSDWSKVWEMEWI